MFCGMCYLEQFKDGYCEECYMGTKEDVKANAKALDLLEEQIDGQMNRLEREMDDIIQSLQLLVKQTNKIVQVVSELQEHLAKDKGESILGLTSHVLSPIRKEL